MNKLIAAIAIAMLATPVLADTPAKPPQTKTSADSGKGSASKPTTTPAKTPDSKDSGKGSAAKPSK